MQVNQNAKVIDFSQNMVNQNIPVWPKWDLFQHAYTYSCVDDIYAIIRLIATTSAGIPFYAYELTDDNKSFRALHEKKAYLNPYRYKSLQRKALEDLPEDDPIAILLENPHGNMSKFEWFESLYSYLHLDGEAFILKERAFVGRNQGMPVQLTIMPPQNVILKITQTLPRRIVGYDYRINGELIYENIPAEDVIHIKYWNPIITYNGEELRGLSPIHVLKRRLTRLESNMNVSVAQLQNSGVPGIVFDKSNGADEEAVNIVGKRKTNFYKYLADPGSKGAPYFGSGDMGYIQLGMKLADLTADELATVDFKKLCNVFGASDVLFNSKDTNSENNVAIQTKRLYTNTILPNIFRIRDGLVKGLLPDFRNGITMPGENGEIVRISGDGKDRYIDADLTDVTELHEDLNKRATWMVSAWWLTPNEKREMMNYDRYDDPLFDQPLLPVGMETIQDFETIPPIDPVTPNGN